MQWVWRPLHWLRRIVYRIGQFVRGLTARVSVQEMGIVSQILPKAAVALFTQMPVDAQRHSLNVLYAVQGMAEGESSLARAALLHDIGKIAAAQAGVPIRLWLRGPLVLAEALWPRFLARQALADVNQGWRYALYVQRMHPQIGAEMAQQTGCDPLTCWLIAHHQDKADKIPVNPPDRRTQLLRILQQADQRR